MSAGLRIMLAVSVACGSWIAAEDAPTTAAAVVATVQEEVGETAVAEPMDAAYARALSAAAQEYELPDRERQRLRLAIAEAWLAAGDATRSAETIGPLLDAAGVLSEERERLGSLRLRLWEHQIASGAEPTTADPVDLLQPATAFPPTLLGRAAVLRAERALSTDAVDEAIDAYDEALAYLASEPANERAAVFGLRLLAMELRGDPTEEIAAWFADREGDPAAQAVAANLFAQSDRLEGQPVPDAIQGPALDGGRIAAADLAADNPVLIVFFASGSQACAAIMPALVQLQRESPAGLQLMGITMDEHQAVEQTRAFLARFGADFPVLVDGEGWRGPYDEALSVDRIPTLILVAEGGDIQATNIATDGAGSMVRQIRRLLGADETSVEEMMP